MNNKICIKMSAVDRKHCGTGRHMAKHKVETDTAYIRHTDNQVYATPTLDLKLLTVTQRSKLLSMEFSAKDWEQLFSEIQAGSIPDWLLEEQESVLVT